MARTGLLLECMDCPVKKRAGADSETAKTLLSQAASKVRDAAEFCGR
jgi:hypothetical protein